VHRTTLIVGAAITLLASSLLASPAFAAGFLDDPVPPPTDKIVIDLVTVNGSGCPAGTAAVAMTPDNTAFTVTFSNYIALVGVGSTATDFRKNCQLNVLVHVPQGFTYAIADSISRGFKSVATGASATFRENFYFTGDPQTASVTHPITAGDGDFEYVDSVSVAALVFAPCGAERNLNTNTSLQVSTGTSDPKKTTSLVTLDSIDQSIVTQYHFAWRHCP
jgi:hypothetical protein